MGGCIGRRFLLCLATNRVESDFVGREEGRFGLQLIEVEIAMWGRRALAVEREREVETALCIVEGGVALLDHARLPIFKIIVTIMEYII